MDRGHDERRPVEQGSGWVTLRALAFVMDTVLLTTVLFGIGVVIRLILGPAFEARIGPGGELTLVGHPWVAGIGSVLTSLAGIAYFVACWRLWGSTPGQWILGLQVRSARGDRYLSTGRSVVRWVGLGGPLWIAAAAAPGMVGLASSMAAPAWMLVLLWTTVRSPGGRGVHDRWADSVVVRTGRKRARLEAAHVR